MLQFVAVYYRVLQCIKNGRQTELCLVVDEQGWKLHCVAECCSALQCATVCCNVSKTGAKQNFISSSMSKNICCSVLHCVAECSSVFAVCCSVLQCVAMCCNVLQYVVACCSVLQCVKKGNQRGLWLIVDELDGMLQCVAVCCSIMLRVAVCCSVMLRVAVCCSVILRVAVCQKQAPNRALSGR